MPDQEYMCQKSEDQNRLSAKSPIEGHDEHLISASLRNLVNTYGIAVQQTTNNQLDNSLASGFYNSNSNNMLRQRFGQRGSATLNNFTQVLPLVMLGLFIMLLCYFGRRFYDRKSASKLSSNHMITPMTAANKDKQKSVKCQNLFDRFDSEEEFKAASSDHYQKDRQSSTMMNMTTIDGAVSSSASRDVNNWGQKTRAATAKQCNGQKAHAKQQSWQVRQDLNFNSRAERAELAMKEQKLLLFQQKLHQTKQRAVKESFQGEIISSMKEAQKIADGIAEQAERNLSSDYNTKAIATRLRSIAQRRIQTAKQKAIAASREIDSQYSRPQPVYSSRNHHSSKQNYNNSHLEVFGSQRANEKAGSAFQITEASLSPDKGLQSSTKRLKLNDHTLLVPTEASNKNLLNAAIHSSASEYVNQSDLRHKIHAQKQNEMFRNQSGLDQKMNRITLVKVSQQERRETLSPFDEIPIISNKKNKRPATGAGHHYIKQGDGPILGNKTSAQTLLA